ncbi:MAG: hypothetical protein WBQ08_24300 [Candidatus Sulfotelmatobacter sp.]
MDHPRIVLLAALIVIIAFVAPTSFAQDTSNFPYMNPNGWKIRPIREAIFGGSVIPMHARLDDRLRD